jgi:zinc transport system substrate-binding protein
MSFIKKMSFLVVVLNILTTDVYAVNKVNVFVSILPQQYFVQRIGTEHVNVHVMVGPGQNPATYEPTPRQMAALSKADIYFSIGVPFEAAWLDKIHSTNKELKLIECCKTISDLENKEHSHHHEQYDPHIWTSPKKVIQLISLIEKSLVENDSLNSEEYKKSAQSFVNELLVLDENIRLKTVALNKRDLFVSHPSWTYFAEEYGFEQFSIEQEGKEIQASSMVNLIKLAKEKKVNAIFVQPQFNWKAARVIASEINADILELDPLAYDYLENMNDVTEKIVKGLSNE